MTDESAKQICRSFLEIIGRRDRSALANLLADDLRYWICGTLPGMSGTRDKNGFLSAVGMLWDVIDGAPTVHIDSMIEEGGRVCMIAHGTMRLKTGGDYNNNYVIVLDVRDGKITAGREYFDTLLVSKAFGIPDAAKAA